MIKIAIKGHLTRGKEVIQILESLGGINTQNYLGNNFGHYYGIYGNTIICSCTKSDNYKYYTLEEFEKKFPFKVGDIVLLKGTNDPYEIVELTQFMNTLCYKLDNGFYYIPNVLTTYEKMKEERNITLTLDKAKEWYKKGGELKEVALQAYSEEELTKVELPKTWEEFRENNPVKAGECWLAQQDIIHQAFESCNRIFKNWIPSKKSAEAHLALIQLEQLRDCYRQGDIPDFNNNNEKYCIVKTKNLIHIAPVRHINYFLSFNKINVAQEFLNNFKPLIEIAEDYI